MRVFVTGSRGFIGSHLVAAWERLGVEVVGIDPRDRPQPRDDPFHGHEELSGATEDDVVYLLGANPNVSASVEEPQADIHTNLEAVVRQMGWAVPAHIVFASTFGGMFSGTTEMVSETATPNPHAPYFVGKLAAEHYLALLSTVKTILRLANVYGPRHTEQIAPAHGVVHDWMVKARAGDAFDLWGSPNASRDYTYIDDIIDAFVRVGTQRCSGIYHIGTGHLTTLDKLAADIEYAAGYTKAREFETEASHIGYVLAGARVNNERAWQVLGWRPHVALEEGLRRTWLSYKPRAQAMDPYFTAEHETFST